MKEVHISCIDIVRICMHPLSDRRRSHRCINDAPNLRTRSAISSNTLPPCMTITLEAISSVL